MRHGRPSFWHGVQPSTAHPLGLKIICEVDGDDPPGADHAACLVAIRRRHLKDVAACLPLIQRRLSEMRLPTDIAAEDLRLVGVHLCAKPMITARQVLEYRAALVPMLLFLVVFLHGKPASLHIERRL
jgi:hypothetical protein